jgi:3',5'-cyclic AMP phosphodiesterase CpdA
MAPLRIAHLSDVHLGPLIGFSPRYWNAKRLFGCYNWHVNRRSVHLPRVVDTLLGDLSRQQIDHVAISGDLVNIGLPAEHVRALDWLAKVGPPERVSVVPGNHDIYTEMGADPGAMRWQAYMRCDERGRTTHTPDAFPYVRRIGPLVLIGVNSAIPTAPGIAIGRVGAEQRTRLGDALRRNAGLFRLVMIHHPPVPGHARRHHELTDAAEVDAVLTEAGAELVIHGHNHTNTLVWRGSKRPVPVVGVASASAARSYEGAPLARYQIYSIRRAGTGWTIQMEARGLADSDGSVVELERRYLHAPSEIPSTT